MTIHPLRILALGVATALGLLAASQGHSDSVSADHSPYRCGGSGMLACLRQTTAFVEQVVKPAGEVRFCINPRGLQYPGFRSQTNTVMQRWAADLRLPAREVPYPSSYFDRSCLVRNDMRDDHPCSGCGAWIFTDSLPLLIEYNARTGYSRWDSTIGHEVGHGFCLLDEHYDKGQFRSYVLTYGRWIHGAPTVMDSGTFALPAYSPLGIWFPTPEYDLDRCEETLGRDLDPVIVEPPPPCEGPVEASGLYWDWCIGRWVNEGGWRYDPLTGVWELPDGTPEWSGCEPWGGRFHFNRQVWMHVGHGLYTPERGFWSFAPPC